MTKQAFMEALNKGLSNLPQEDREQITEYYSEMISDRMEDGLSEEAAVQDVGSWEDIAQQILSEIPQHTEKNQEADSRPDHHVYINGMSLSDFLSKRRNGKVPTGKENVYKSQEAFSSLRITAGACDVTLSPATDGQFCLVHKNDFPDAQCHVYVEQDVLYVERQVPSRNLGNIGKAPTIELFLPKSQYNSLQVTTGSGDIELPASFTFSTVSLKTTSGDAKVFCSVEGDMDIKVSSGDITGRNLRIMGGFHLESTSGDVKLRGADIGQGFYGKTSSGDVQLKDVRTTAFSLTTSSGDVNLEVISVKEEMEMTTSSGDINMEYCLAGKLKVRTTSGDVQFESCDARNILMNTVSGDIEGSLQKGKVFVTKTCSGDIRVPPSLSNGDKCALQTLSGDARITVER